MSYQLAPQRTLLKSLACKNWNNLYLLSESLQIARTISEVEIPLQELYYVLFYIH